MLYHLLYPLAGNVKLFNIFKYLTVRTIYAMITALLVCFVLGPWVIRMLEGLQARQVIRSVVVCYRETPGGPARTTHAFVHIAAADRQPFYTSSAVAMADPALRAKAVRQAWNELQAFRRRYQDLIEFGQLFATLDQLEQTLPPLIAA